MAAIIWRCHGESRYVTSNGAVFTKLPRLLALLGNSSVPVCDSQGHGILDLATPSVMTAIMVVYNGVLQGQTTVNSVQIVLSICKDLHPEGRRSIESRH